MKNKPVGAIALATWFGCGRVPKAPGTAGAVGGLLPVIPALLMGEFSPHWTLALAALVTPFGIWASTETARFYRMKDPQIVVIDEVLGQWITLAGAVRLNTASIVLAFVLFRLFDIWKPWPVRRLEQLSEGAGIVADDLMAGVYGALVLFGLGCFNLY